MTYLLLYIITAVLTYGGSFAYWQRKYTLVAEDNYKEQMYFSLAVAVVPIAGFVIVLFATGFYKHGFKFK